MKQCSLNSHFPRQNIVRLLETFSPRLISRMHASCVLFTNTVLAYTRYYFCKQTGGSVYSPCSYDDNSIIVK